MTTREFDVVIVGSGIAGAVMARVLTQAGKSVLMLEAGLTAGADLTPEMAFAGYHSYLQTFYEKANKATNGPYPDLPAAPSPDVLEILPKMPSDKGYLVQMGPLPFASDCLRAPGGTTLHWLGNVPRMLPNDFRMKTLYGRGVDWPISYAQLQPYYEMAELEIGVAGDVSAQVGPDMSRANYGPGYEFPMRAIPQSYQDQVWIRNSAGEAVELAGESYHIQYVSMPQGRNAVPNPAYPYAGVTWCPSEQRLRLDPATSGYEPVGSVWSPYTGERCEGNASCVPICPVQAKYNALKTLRRANRDHLRIVTQAVASKLVIDPDTRRISGIEYKSYASATDPRFTMHVAKGRLYVLAAGALENAKLLLMSDAANSSDQVGRNLMDHLVMLTWGLFRQDKVYPYRGPGCTTYIPTFRDGAFRKDFSAWISPLDNWGWSWPTFAPGSDVQKAIGRGLFGPALREHLENLLPRQALLHFECEQLPAPDNRITIDPMYLDPLGNPRPVIHYGVSDYERRSFAEAKRVCDQIFGKARIQDLTSYGKDDPDHVEWEGKGYTFWGAGHIVGTHRMGDHAANSVVDPAQRSWDHENLYLIGCGNMPTLGTSNPTLTMTALTFMAAENILRHLANGTPGGQQ